MEFSRLSGALYEISRSVFRNRFGSRFYSMNSMPRHRFGEAGKSSISELYRRISPVGNPNVSIVPILDQWVEEGRSVDKAQLQSFIKEFRRYKRYSHALQISMWMTDKRFYMLSSSDVAIRLDLMSKVQGIEQVEDYFNNIPQQLKGLKVYGALLNCYAYAKSVEKAEEVMQKMKDLGFTGNSLSYNVMLSLYHKTGNFEKLRALLHKMEENGIVHDRVTFSIRLSACSAASDIEGMEKILKRMESDTRVVPDWTSYSTAADGYTKAGLVDKALEMLKKSEALVTSKRRSMAYNYLLTQYAATGKKDEVLRLWQLYKKKEKVYTNGYGSILSALVKVDDFEKAEKIFDEWESKDLNYNIRIPNFLIGAYSRKGLFEKAETLLDRVISKGEQPTAWTWYCLAIGYLQNDQPQKGVEMMKKAIMISEPQFKPSAESLTSCLKYLKREGDIEQAEQFLKLLLDSITLDIKEKLLKNIKAGSRT